MFIQWKLHRNLPKMRARLSMHVKGRREKGFDGEDLAVQFLKDKGLIILDRNFRYDRGEIDIIAEEGEMLVFVEVKTRHSTTFGEPEESVTDSKQRQIEKVASGYMMEHEIDDRPIRFDIISIMRKGNSTEMRHIENAF